MVILGEQDANEFEFAKDLMQGILKKNSGRGMEGNGPLNGPSMCQQKTEGHVILGEQRANKLGFAKDLMHGSMGF